jgi:4,5-dihydroxyphthalate decarboxylase
VPELAREPVVLRTALGRHPIGVVLRSREVASPEVAFDFADVEPIHRAFAPMVREQAYDVSELAIVTALQAIAYGHPIVILPVVVAARFQRRCLITLSSGSAGSRPAGSPSVGGPGELRGKRVGVRAYTQTTGFWIRSHLAEDYGLAASDIDWVTQDEAHVPEYTDPPFVHRTLSGGLVDALRAGDIDAAILGNDLPAGDEFAPVIDRPAERDRDWHARHGYVPVNHVISVSAQLLERSPDAVRAVWRLFAQAEERAAAGAASGAASGASGVRVTMSGLGRLTGPIEEIAAACFAQGMLPRPLTADEIFAPARQLDV